jgi:hypothetical protein
MIQSIEILSSAAVMLMAEMMRMMAINPRAWTAARKVY